MSRSRSSRLESPLNLAASALDFCERLPEYWLAAFPPASLERGRRHQRNGKVSLIGFAKDELRSLAIGEIEGAGGRRYQSRLWLVDDDEPGADELNAGEFGDDEFGEDEIDPDLATACSCPDGEYCEHAAALVYAIVAAADAAEGDDGADTTLPADRHVGSGTAPGLPKEWQHLVATLAQADPPEPAASWPEQQQLAFIFGASHGLPPALLVGPALVRAGKRGGFAGARNLNATVERPQPWTEPQFAIVAALATAPRQPTKPVPMHRITDPHQEAAIERALASELCFFERAADGRLGLGPLRDLRWAWTGQADGGQTLHFSVAGCEQAQLLVGHGLWYFDPRAKQVGRISTGYDQFHAMLGLPALAPEHVAVLTERLSASAAARLPAPEARPPLERLTAPPRALLVMRMVKRWDWQQDRNSTSDIPVGRLFFDYGGYRLQPRFRATERHYRNGHLVEVVRDQGAEWELYQSLVGQGWMSVTQKFPFGITSEYNDLFAHGDHQRPVAIKDMPARLSALRAAGVLIEYDPSYPHHRLLVAGSWSAEVDEAGSDWFDLSLGVEVEGERLDLLPILRSVIADSHFPRKASAGEQAAATWTVELDAERKLALPLARLRALVDPLWEWLELGPSGLKLRRSQVHVLAAMESGAGLPWQGGDRLRRCLEQLTAVPVPAAAPAGFKTELRPYQREGLAWLDRLATARMGGVLADDMGLGKTVQVLAHLLDLKQRHRLGRPALVVAPTSLLGNWKAEAERFAPQLRVLVIHGLNRVRHFQSIDQHDLVITSYPLLQRDRDSLLAQHFSLLILDEAQAIKNARSQAASVVRELKAERRLGMTGTPLENHLGELWAQFDAVEPGLLGDQRQFNRLFRTPIEKHQDADKQRRLNARIAPLMLRRRKQDVLTDLPEKTEIVRAIDIEGGQRELYETLRLAQHQRVQEAIAERGLAQSGIVVLDALLKLRQCCCDPRLVKLAHAKKIVETAKLDALLDLLDGLLSEGRRVLVFSQFAEMLGLIGATLVERGIAHQQLTGDTPATLRSGLVANFQNGAVPVFLISLKAGGVGLNLTAADTVIHYDPWWNPAVEAQATDRAHRIGQDKAVFVYKLICAGTVEEKIQALQARKSDLARAVLDGGGASSSARFDASDLAELFAPL